MVDIRNQKYNPCRLYLDFGFPVDPVVVQRVLGDGRAVFVRVLDEGDVLFRGHCSDIHEVWVSDVARIQLGSGNSECKIQMGVL